MVRREGRGLATRAFAVLVTLRIVASMRLVRGGVLYPVIDGIVPVLLLVLLHFVLERAARHVPRRLREALGLRSRRRRATAMVMTLPLGAFLAALYQHRFNPIFFLRETSGSDAGFFLGLAIGSSVALAGFVRGICRADERAPAASPATGETSTARGALRLAAVAPPRDPFAPLLVLVGGLAVAIAYVPPSPSHVASFTLLDGLYLLGTGLALGRYLLGRRAIVGRDGLLLGRLAPRFVPFALVDRAEVRDDGLELFHGHERLARLEASPADPSALEEVARRVAQAEETRAIGDVERAMLALPALGDPRAHAYRQGQLSAAQLWQLVEASATPADLRLRAATRLSQTVMAEEPRASAREVGRLRIAAETCLEPETRAALEALADENRAPLLADAEEPVVASLRS